jgi:hypothetical protein
MAVAPHPSFVLVSTDPSVVVLETLKRRDLDVDGKGGSNRRLPELRIQVL